jgi:hypothetical protein
MQQHCMESSATPLHSQKNKSASSLIIESLNTLRLVQKKNYKKVVA